MALAFCLIARIGSATIDANRVCALPSTPPTTTAAAAAKMKLTGWLTGASGELIAMVKLSANKVLSIAEARGRSASGDDHCFFHGKFFTVASLGLAKIQAFLNEGFSELDSCKNTNE